MSLAASPEPTALVELLNEAAAAVRALLADARAALRPGLTDASGALDRARADEHQHAVHGLAWWATYSETVTQVAAWAQALAAQGALTEVEVRLAGLLVAEYVAQLAGGLPMNQGEVVRPAHLGVTAAQVLHRLPESLRARLDAGAGDAEKQALADLLVRRQGSGTFEASGLDPEFEMLRDQFHTFSERQIRPHAHKWHLADDLIPLDLVHNLADLGVFGLTIPAEYGGSGFGKVAMCIVSEELSRGYIGVGSLPTRSEIAGELILSAGTAAQKQAWLPGLARGEVLPTAVFTEPGAGSDLAGLRTRAQRRDDVYYVTGAKTWITHASRADLMTLLVRTDSASTGHRGISILLAPKQRGDEVAMFRDPGLQGGEIPVIGYRGMREYELGFEDFAVDAANLLGGVEGLGFAQLMATFESARIQTAARAVGVAQCALDLGLTYALGRRQFDRALIQFPRVANKLVMMAAEIMAVRRLTYFAASRKDEGRRCDLEAGMAKLLGARVAWAAADNALQIHGGNGFAVEYPVSRLLADARILNIFEGAGEIQAQVIGRRILEEAPSNSGREEPHT